MKWVLLVTAISFVFGVVSGCGDKKSASHDGTRRAGPGRGVNPNTVGPNSSVNPQTGPGTSAYWGSIVPQQGNVSITSGGNVETNAYLDNDVARYFLITNYDFKNVGATTNNPDTFIGLPCHQGQRCVVGLTLGTDQNNSHLPLTLQNSQTINQVMTSNAQVPVTGGGITMGFWDSLTGTQATAEDGTTYTITPIPIYIPLDTSNSYVNRNQIVLNFRDDSGTLTLNGTAQQNGSYSGTIGFVNFNDYAGSGAQYQGTLGTFTINVCAAFRCN